MLQHSGFSTLRRVMTMTMTMMMMMVMSLLVWALLCIIITITRHRVEKPLCCNVTYQQKQCPHKQGRLHKNILASRGTSCAIVAMSKILCSAWWCLDGVVQGSEMEEHGKICSQCITGDPSTPCHPQECCKHCTAVPCHNQHRHTPHPAYLICCALSRVYHLPDIYQGNRRRVMLSHTPQLNTPTMAGLCIILAERVCSLETLTPRSSHTLSSCDQLELLQYLGRFGRLMGPCCILHQHITTFRHHPNGTAAIACDVASPAHGPAAHSC
jgi:hypothetical protein